MVNVILHEKTYSSRIKLPYLIHRKRTKTMEKQVKAFKTPW